MFELKTKVNSIMNQLNKAWAESIKKGEETGGIDLSEMFSKYSQSVDELDKAFLDAEKRIKGKKKLFG